MNITIVNYNNKNIFYNKTFLFIMIIISLLIFISLILKMIFICKDRNKNKKYPVLIKSTKSIKKIISSPAILENNNKIEEAERELNQEEEKCLYPFLGDNDSY